jgi:hypothetical protein
VYTSSILPKKKTESASSVYGKTHIRNDQQNKLRLLSVLKPQQTYNAETIYSENPCDFSSGIAALAD